MVIICHISSIEALSLLLFDVASNICVRTWAEVSIYDPIGFDKEGNEISLMDGLFADNDILETADIAQQTCLIGRKSPL